MELFAFFRWVLVITVTTTLFWPLTVPLAALAYKMRLGPAPVPMPTSAFWTRSAFAALGLAVMALALAGLDYLLAQGGFPPGVVHFALLLPDPEWAPDDTIAPSCQGGVACMRNVLDASDLDSALSTVKSTLARLDPSTAAAYVFGELRLTRRFTELFAALGFAPERVASKPYWRDDRANEANGEPDRDAG